MYYAFGQLAEPAAKLAQPYFKGSSAFSTTYWPTFLPISVPTTVEKR
jgi:hypothetical protein